MRGEFLGKQRGNLLILKNEHAARFVIAAYRIHNDKQIPVCHRLHQLHAGGSAVKQLDLRGNLIMRFQGLNGANADPLIAQQQIPNP